MQALQFTNGRKSEQKNRAEKQIAKSFKYGNIKKIIKQTQKTNKTREEIRLFFIPLYFEHQTKKTYK